MSERWDLEECRQSVDDLVALGERQIGRPDLHHVRGNVDRQLAAGAVVDEAAGRSKRDLGVLVLLGEAGVVAALHDLEVEEPRRQEPDNENDDEPEHRETESEPGSRRRLAAEHDVSHLFASG